MKKDIWSPCIKVCLVDPEQRVCVGCFRTLEELGRWSRMSDAEREAVRPRLDERRSEYLSRRAARGVASAPEAAPCRGPGGGKACAGPASCAAMGLDCPALR